MRRSGPGDGCDHTPKRHMMAYLSLNTRDTARDGLIGRITDYLRSDRYAIMCLFGV